MSIKSMKNICSDAVLISFHLWVTDNSHNVIDLWVIKARLMLRHCLKLLLYFCQDYLLLQVERIGTKLSRLNIQRD